MERKNGITDNGLVAAKGQPRSPQWPAVEEAFLKKYPACFCCGSTVGVQVHHKFPFHFCVALGRADLELDERNLMTLCETELNKVTQNHHLLIGHLDSWESFDAIKDVANDAQVVFKNMDQDKIKVNPMWQAKKASRPKTLNEMTQAEKDALRKLMDSTFPKRTFNTWINKVVYELRHKLTYTQHQ